MGYVDISTRISIRWLPDPASEPSDVLVHNVGSYYLDLRILKESGEIDWAFAGERQVISTEPLKCQWIHLIDSTGQSTPDSGTFSKLPNGDDLEVGSMPCPSRGGALTDYEEVWRTLALRQYAGCCWGWILQSMDGKCFLSRIGGGLIGMREEGEGKFGVRCEQWEDENGGWRSKYAVGGVDGVPSFVGTGGLVVDGEEGWKVGDLVVVQGVDFVVRAFERFDDDKVQRSKDT